MAENKFIPTLLPNLEEHNSGKRDKLGRYLYKYSSQYDLTKAKTSESIAKQKGNKWLKWPDGKEFALCLTHDIDHLQTYWKMVVRRLSERVTKYDFAGIKDGIKWYLMERFTPKNIFKHIVEIEKCYGATSSFYFMATEDWDKRYSIEDYKSILTYIEAEGCEVGLHPGMDSYNNLDILKEEKKRLELILGKEVVGLRQHYLRFDPRITWQNQIKAGFLYDCSYGYPDHIGFKNGSAHPFSPIDVNTNEELPLLEIPLVIMDGTISSYMNLPYETHFEEAWEACKKVLDEVRAVGGCSSILWHSDQFNDSLYPKSEAFYKRILQYGKDNNAWMTSGKNIYHYLMSNS